MTTSIVPYESKEVQVYSLVDTPVKFTTREEVKKHLTDICGNVLARAWHDKNYEKMLQDDPRGTFVNGGVLLHDAFRLEYDKTSGNLQRLLYMNNKTTANLNLKFAV